MANFRVLTAMAAMILMLLGLGNANAGAIIADYTTIPDGQAPSFSLAGTTVTGSADVFSGSYIGERGLGIVGDQDNNSLDVRESMTIDYGQLVTNVTLTVRDIPQVGNALYQVEAFASGGSLGARSLPFHTLEIETNDLTALFDGLSFSKITIRCIGGIVCLPAAVGDLGIQIQATSYDIAPPVVAVAEPGTLALLGLGLVGLGWTRRRKAG
ncbi:PEP-CTERM sorting domain-containing protein [Denitrobaculum tricleocarpae]|uniref:PEP-CTERM sorting domain-containing protein n=1 Tax=Denitrobaculum tricleocarpae TaxID=2591009 RepID=UPI001C55357B|nr:PEP-CTERM sorting domain-containing protein [Denitrobaculum tricleocarpae]